jgi:hypothetical protein
MKQDLSERFLEFAVSIIKLGKKLNKTSVRRPTDMKVVMFTDNYFVQGLHI